MTYRLRDEFIGLGHRMYQPMLELQTLSSAILLSLEVMILGPSAANRWKLDTTAQTVSAQFPDLMFKLNYVAPMYAAAHGKSVGAIQVTLDRVQHPENQVGLPQAHSAVNRALLSVGTLTYIAFYERWRPEMERRFTREIRKWPPLFAFARRIRDFLVHTNGEVRFNSSNADPVSWHRITYSPADNGRRILNAELAFADLLALMFELDDEMSARHFPTA